MRRACSHGRPLARPVAREVHRSACPSPTVVRGRSTRPDGQLDDEETDMADAPWQRAARGAGLLAPDGSIAATIFAEMSSLAARTGAINLGQGFPDEDGPAEV